jgi:hypothetical protein
MNFFMNLKNTSCLMKITVEGLPNEMKQDRATEKWHGYLNSKIQETSITWKIPNPIRTIDQAQEEALHLGEGEGEVDPRNSQTIIQEIHTSTDNIMEEVIAPKGALKPRRTLLEFNKRRPWWVLPPEKHGYPWVPTDQRPRGPCQVDPTCQKSCRPASGPGDLVYNLGDPGRPWKTLSRS